MIVGYSRTFPGAGLVYLPPTDTVIDFSIDPDDADARFSLFLDGNYYHFGAGVNTSQGAWLLSGVNSDYEARATTINTTGAATRTGTVGSWLVLSSDRTWRITKTSGTGLATWDLTIEIRRVSDSVVVASCTLYMEAEVDI